MNDAYKPLTKIETDIDGNQKVTCRFAGTDMCRAIHTNRGCNGCPVLDAIFKMLHTFEEIYLNKDEDKEKK